MMCCVDFVKLGGVTLFFKCIKGEGLAKRELDCLGKIKKNHEGYSRTVKLITKRVK